MACNFKVNIEFRLPIKKAIEVMEYCESRGMDFIGMCDNNPYDYNSDIQSLEYHNSIWMENNLERIIKNCNLSKGSVYKKIYENVYADPYVCFMPKEDILIY